VAVGSTVDAPEGVQRQGEEQLVQHNRGQFLHLGGAGELDQMRERDRQFRHLHRAAPGVEAVGGAAMQPGQDSLLRLPAMPIAGTSGGGEGAVVVELARQQFPGQEKDRPPFFRGGVLRTGRPCAALEDGVHQFLAHAGIERRFVAVAIGDVQEAEQIQRAGRAVRLDASDGLAEDGRLHLLPLAEGKLGQLSEELTLALG